MRGFLRTLMLIASATDTIVGGLIAAMAGVVAGLGAARIQSRSAERERLAAERTARLKEAASAIGATLSLLRRAQPSLVAIPREEANKIITEEYWPRWDPLQAELEVVAAAHPRDVVSEKVDAVIEEVRGLLSDLRYYVDVRGGGRNMRAEESTQLQTRHSDAIARTKELLAEIRAE